MIYSPAYTAKVNAELKRLGFNRTATASDLAAVKRFGLGAIGRSRPSAIAGGEQPVAEKSPEQQLQDLITTLTPKPVAESELDSRFSAIYDPTFAGEEADLGQEITQRTSRFGEDLGIADYRRNRSRALALGQTKEALAAGGASGQLADEQTQRQVQPYDDQAADSALNASRFGTDIGQENEKRLRGIRQRKTQSRASYLSDPNLRYEFSN